MKVVYLEKENPLIDLKNFFKNNDYEVFYNTKKIKNVKYIFSNLEKKTDQEKKFKKILEFSKILFPDFIIFLFHEKLIKEKYFQEFCKNLKKKFNSIIFKINFSHFEIPQAKQRLVFISGKKENVCTENLMKIYKNVQFQRKKIPFSIQKSFDKYDLLESKNKNYIFMNRENKYQRSIYPKILPIAELTKNCLNFEYQNFGNILDPKIENDEPEILNMKKIMILQGIENIEKQNCNIKKNFLLNVFPLKIIEVLFKSTKDLSKNNSNENNILIFKNLDETNFINNQTKRKSKIDHYLSVNSKEESIQKAIEFGADLEFDNSGIRTLSYNFGKSEIGDKIFLDLKKNQHVKSIKIKDRKNKKFRYDDTFIN